MGHPTETNTAEHQHLPPAHNPGDQVLAMSSNAVNPSTLPATSVPPINTHSNNEPNQMTSTNAWPQFTHQEQQSQVGMEFLRTTGPPGPTSNYPDLSSILLGYPNSDQGYMAPPPEGFDEAVAAQQNFWQESLASDSDVSLAFAFHPNMWDDEFLSTLSFEGL